MTCRGRRGIGLGVVTRALRGGNLDRLSDLHTIQLCPVLAQQLRRPALLGIGIVRCRDLGELDSLGSTGSRRPHGPHTLIGTGGSAVIC